MFVVVITGVLGGHMEGERKKGREGKVKRRKGDARVRVKNGKRDEEKGWREGRQKKGERGEKKMRGVREKRERKERRVSKKR